MKQDVKMGLRSKCFAKSSQTSKDDFGYMWFKVEPKEVFGDLTIFLFLPFILKILLGLINSNNNLINTLPLLISMSHSTSQINYLKKTNRELMKRKRNQSFILLKIKLKKINKASI